MASKIGFLKLQSDGSNDNLKQSYDHHETSRYQRQLKRLRQRRW